MKFALFFALVAICSLPNFAFGQSPVAAAVHEYGGGSISNGGAGMATDSGFVFDNVRGQTFTAEATGLLFDVSFIATRLDVTTNADLRIDVFNFESGQPTEMLGTTFIPAEEFEDGFLVDTPDAFNHTANFLNSNISITAGDQYAVLFSTDVTEANYRIYGDRSGYDGGNQIRSQNGGQFSNSSLDLFFRVNTIVTPEAAVLGDVNLDGVVSFLDISPFISVLAAGEFQAQADCNGDGEVNFLDIAPFIQILAG